jgi:hypothetical protein
MYNHVTYNMWQLSVFSTYKMEYRIDKFMNASTTLAPGSKVAPETVDFF